MQVLLAGIVRAARSVDRFGHLRAREIGKSHLVEFEWYGSLICCRLNRRYLTLNESFANGKCSYRVGPHNHEHAGVLAVR